MIDSAKIIYSVVAITKDSRQLNITDSVVSLSWSEGEKELAAKINLKVANATFEDKPLAQYLVPFVQIIICADDGEGSQEVMRGSIQKLQFVESNKDFYLQIECADEVQALRRSQDDFFFSDDHNARTIIEDILKAHGVKYEIKIESSVKLGKKVYRKKYLCDALADVLKDLKEKSGGIYFIRAKGGVIEIIPRGTNATIYHFDIADNAVKVAESFDASKLVTRVKVVGKQRTEGKQHVDSIVDGRTDCGVRQVIYERPDKETAAEAETAAKKILDENGVKRETKLDAPDLPTLRKGDRIRLTSSTGTGFFFVKSIHHDAAQMKMKLDLDYDKDYSEAQGLPVYELAKTDESASSEAP